MSDADNFDHLRTEFDGYYYQKIWPKLAEKESLRLKHLHRFWILVFIMCLLLPAFIVKVWGDFIYTLFLQGNREDIEGFIKLFLMAAAVILMIIGAPIVAYQENIKDSIIEDFINFFGSFRHFSARKISDADIKQSRLFSVYDRHLCDDYFCGTYKNTPMIIAEEEMSRKQGKYRTTVFKGIIIIIDLPKPVTGQTVVLDDRGFFNFLNNAGKGLQRIALEDVIFEKEFEAFGSNQIEARCLLTTAFMERMLKVRETFKGKKIKFSFWDNRLLIAVNTSTDMFEPASLFKCSTDRRPINEVLEQFISVFAIADILKLTQR